MHMLCVFILLKLYNIDYIISYWMFIFLPTVSVVFLLEYTVMLLLITSVKVRSTRTYMCEISSILLTFCARFWQISSKIFVIPPQISSIFSAWREWQPWCGNLANFIEVTGTWIIKHHSLFLYLKSGFHVSRISIIRSQLAAFWIELNKIQQYLGDSLFLYSLKS